MVVWAVSLVILSGLIHSTWNLFTKKSLDKHVFLWFCQGAAVAIFLPLAAAEWQAIRPLPAAGWLLLIGSVAVHGCYIVLLARTYTVGDLSQVYPIMRGTSPLLVPIAGVLLLQEQLTLIGWCGVLGIVAGVGLAGGWSFKRTGLYRNRSVLLALLVGLMIMTYTLIDKQALAYLPAGTLNEATNVGNLLALSFTALRSDGIRREWRVNWRTILLGGLMAPGGYLLFLHAMDVLPVAQIAPMREIGTVFGTLYGVFLLREPQGRARLLGSLFITAGVVLLAW